MVFIIEVRCQDAVQLPQPQHLHMVAYEGRHLTGESKHKAIIPLFKAEMIGALQVYHPQQVHPEKVSVISLIFSLPLNAESCAISKLFPPPFCVCLSDG